MAENPFRILLDFRELNFKFYKFVWMSISPRELVTIKDLKDAILKKFSFESTDLQLFLRDGLLPEDENISNILRENDSVRLFHGESSNSNLNESKSISYEYIEPSTSDDQESSSKKRKTQSDVSINLEVNEQEKCNKKRKHSFSNGTYLCDSDSTPATSALINTAPDNVGNVSRSKLYNFETQHNKSCKIKKKLKFTNDISQFTPISVNETFSSIHISPRSEKNESRVNSCKKKKKHKHSKDTSEKDNLSQNDISTMSEINENESSSRKKKKKSHYSVGAETAVSVNNMTEELDDSVNVFEPLNDDLSEMKESLFETVNDDSEILKLASNSFCTSSVNTSSGIGTFTSSKENNQKISSKKNCSKSFNFDNMVTELETSNQLVQGNNCKKKKRKRNRKRKSLSAQTTVDGSSDWNLNISTEKSQNLDSSSTSFFYQTAEISPRTEETENMYKSNAYVSKGSKKCPETNVFLDKFNSCLTNTSTPFTQTTAVSLRNNIISKLPNSSNVSQDQTCSVTSQNAMEKKKNENSPSTASLPNTAIINKNKATVPSHNFLEKGLSNKSYSPAKSTDSVSDARIKSPFLGPTFSYEGCPPLNSCPLAGTHIAYKVLELDETYSPVVSNYKEGRVKAVNLQTDELEIELMVPEARKGRIGKFENIYEDELPPCEVIKKVTLSWSSLINPVQVPNY